MNMYHESGRELQLATSAVTRPEKLVTNRNLTVVKKGNFRKLKRA
jgi:hypothetical protein